MVYNSLFKRNILPEYFVLSTLQEWRTLVVTSSIVFVLTEKKYFFSEIIHQVFRFWLRCCFACCHAGSVMIHLLRPISNECYNHGNRYPLKSSVYSPTSLNQPFLVSMCHTLGGPFLDIWTLLEVVTYGFRYLLSQFCIKRSAWKYLYPAITTCWHYPADWIKEQSCWELF